MKCHFLGASCTFCVLGVCSNIKGLDVLANVHGLFRVIVLYLCILQFRMMGRQRGFELCHLM